MNNGEFRYHLARQVELMPPEKALHLAIVVCKMLFNDYSDFENNYRHGNVQPYTDAIDLCERILVDQLTTIDEAEIARVSDAMQDATPSLIDFEGAEYAFNACEAISHTLNYLSTRNSHYIYTVLICYAGIVGAKLESEYSKANGHYMPDEALNEHPTMIKARTFLLEQTGQ
jgi:hypothetical protein